LIKRRQDLSDFYAENMITTENDQPNTNQSFPSIFSSPQAKWVSDGTTATYKINGQNGISSNKG